MAWHLVEGTFKFPVPLESAPVAASPTWSARSCACVRMPSPHVRIPLGAAVRGLVQEKFFKAELPNLNFAETSRCLSASCTLADPESSDRCLPECQWYPMQVLVPPSRRAGQGNSNPQAEVSRAASGVYCQGYSQCQPQAASLGECVRLGARVNFAGQKCWLAKALVMMLVVLASPQVGSAQQYLVDDGYCGTAFDQEVQLNSASSLITVFSQRNSSYSNSLNCAITFTVAPSVGSNKVVVLQFPTGYNLEANFDYM
jgi:hypothetical protein